MSRRVRSAPFTLGSIGTFTYRGNKLLLPAREFALMQTLMERPGTILSRSQVEERLYG